MFADERAEGLHQGVELLPRGALKLRVDIFPGVKHRDSCGAALLIKGVHFVDVIRWPEIGRGMVQQPVLIRLDGDEPPSTSPSSMPRIYISFASRVAAAQALPFSMPPVVGLVEGVTPGACARQRIAANGMSHSIVRIVTDHL